MTRLSAKLALVTLSLAATVGGWATLAGLDTRSTRPGEGSTLAVGPARQTPTIVQPQTARVIAAAPSASTAPRPLARTRSSR